VAFQIPDGLAPEVYPLSWLVGRWRGPGFIAYPGIPQRAVLMDAVFGHDGGPYLTYAATTYLLESPLESLEGTIDVDALQAGQVWSTESGFWRVTPAGGSPSAQQPARDAGTDTGHGAPSGAGPRDSTASQDGTASMDGPTSQDGAASLDGHGAHQHDGVASAQPNGTSPAGTDAEAGGRKSAPVSDLEVLLAEPTGHVSVYLGRVQGPRIELTTDLVARTASGAEIGAASRMYGLVSGELFWATDLAAFGHELQSYSSGRLQRQE